MKVKGGKCLYGMVPCVCSRALNSTTRARLSRLFCSCVLSVGPAVWLPPSRRGNNTPPSSCTSYAVHFARGRLFVPKGPGRGHVLFVESLVRVSSPLLHPVFSRKMCVRVGAPFRPQVCAHLVHASPFARACVCVCGERDRIPLSKNSLYVFVRNILRSACYDVFVF